MPLASRLPTAMALAVLLAAMRAHAAGPQELLDSWRAEAGGADFSAARGREFYMARSGEWSCSSCHTPDPRQEGRHAVTGKPIAPFAPAANPSRFTHPAKVEKWFRRNCGDVLGRNCTALERGDLLSYLMTLNGAKP